jgi:PAS domain S-box-containing protein
MRYSSTREKVFAQWDRSAKANQLFKYEYRFLRPDGIETWVLGWAGSDRDEQGNLQGYVGTITDIGDRKRIEEQLRKSRQDLEHRVQKRTAELAEATVALRDSQARLDGILASLDDLVWSVSTETFQFLYLSPAVEQIYGRSAAEFLQNPQRWLELVHPEDRERVKQISDGLFNTGQKDIEYRIVRPDGEVRWLRDRARLFSNEDGQPIRIDGIATDITDRKQMQDILQENEERFRKIFTEGPLGMAVVNLNYQFIQVNERLCQMVGYTEDELMTLTFPDISHPDDIESDTHLAKQLHQGEIPYYNLEKRYVKKNQEIVWINLTACLVRDEEQDPLYYLAIIEDISDRKHYEERLETERQQLQQIITHAPVAMVMCDRDLQVLAYSHQWLTDYHLHHLQAESIIGQHLYDILPDIPEHWQEMHRQALGGETIASHS